MTPLHLLVVDDSLADLHLISAAFETHPEVHLTTHDRAPVALEWITLQAAQGQRPDLVILDLHMPGMDGWDWLQAVRQQPALQDVPVLLYSLTPVDRQLQQIDLTQVYACWRKPMGFQEMQDHADLLWEIWQREGFSRTLAPQLDNTQK